MFSYCKILYNNTIVYLYLTILDFKNNFPDVYSYRYNNLTINSS